MLLMQRDRGFRQEQCFAQIAFRTRSRTLSDWDQALLTYIASDVDDAHSRNTLLRLATDSQRRCRSSRAFFIFALKSLLLGDREKAKSDLEKCRSLGYFIESTWAQAYLYRLEHDPSWPAWTLGKGNP